MTTINEINPEVAKELGIPLKTIEYVNKMYWQEVRALIEKPETDNIRIEGFGTFYVSPKRTIKKIIACYMKLRNIEKSEKDLPPEFRQRVISQFREYWDLKNRFKFRLTDKKWRYVNSQVGYVPYKNAKCNSEVIEDEDETDFNAVENLESSTEEQEELTSSIINLDF